MDLDARGQSAWRWPILFSILILNFLLPTLVLCYGVIWIRLAAFEVPLWLGLATPTLFLVVHGLTQCWFREAADSWGGSLGYRVMAVSGLVMVVSSLLICIILPFNVQPIVYGVLGGLGLSLTSAQVDAVIYESYDTRLDFVRGVCFTGQAIGLSLFPHLLSLLMNVYGYSATLLLLAGIMLQALPAILLLKVDETKNSAYLSRYKELSQSFMAFRNEAMDNNIFTTEVQLHNLSKKCWKSPSDDNLHREGEYNFDDGDIIETITPPPSPEEKRRNFFGVEILPEIPEETEESDNDEPNASNAQNTKCKKRLSFAIKRLSNLGDNLDECIVNQVRRDSKSDRDTNNTKEYSEVEVTYDTVSPVTDVRREKIFNSFSFRCQSAYTSLRRKLWIPSYKVYRTKRRTLYVLYYLNDTFLKPLKRSLSSGSFYPALLLSFSKLSLIAISITLLPLTALKINPSLSNFEVNFLISLFGFTWICFLLCTPWLVYTQKRNFKYVTVSGLVISTCACFVLSEANTHDTFSIGCVIAGFGFGAITSSWETAAQEYVGAHKWSKVHSTLETLSAVLLGLLTTGLSFVVEREGGIQFAMYIQGLIMSVITFVWLVIAAISIYTAKVRNINLKLNWRAT
ncbi:uncharacterized protein LOC121728877 [Aricia agestis]|uniref:uncharacterized protein LOC121728877 n=1 Tax=Aricia agestis TaxID=91739 RepID=UPI001C201BA3|nr:uncharacterized protein LOC121728877 [Aricia agestis]